MTCKIFSSYKYEYKDYLWILDVDPKRGLSFLDIRLKGEKPVFSKPVYTTDQDSILKAGKMFIDNGCKGKLEDYLS